jgi:hypothetical protein
MTNISALPKSDIVSEADLARALCSFYSIGTHRD